MLLSMISSSPTFGNWDITKQFMAAQFFLSQEKSLSMNETQRMILGAFHMQATYGPWIPGVLLPDLQGYNTSSKRKWEEEWKKLGNMPRITSMRKFLEFLTNIFPNWSKHPSLYTNFELEWSRNELSGSSQSNSQKKLKDISRDPLKTYTSYCSYESSPKHSFTPKEGKQRIFKRFSGYSHPMFKINDQKVEKNSLGEVHETISTLRKNTISRVTKTSRKDNLLSLPTAEETRETLKPRQASPVLKEFFHKLKTTQDKYGNKKKESYPTQTDESFSEEVKPGLDACIENIQIYLSSLEEKSYNKYEGNMQNSIEKAFNNYETEVIECLLRPKLELIGGILEELESKFREELNPKAEAIAKIKDKYTETVNYVFDYMEKLDCAKTIMKEHSQKTEQQWNLLRKGINSIKELKDPANYKFNLFGNSKQSVGFYTDCVHISKKGLPQEDVDILIELEKIIEQHESKEAGFIKEIEQRDLEVAHLKQILKETQQKSYKDNIELSNQCRIMKESIDLIQGKHETDSATEGILKRQVIELKLENDRLKNEKFQLFELTRNK